MYLLYNTLKQTNSAQKLLKMPVEPCPENSAPVACLFGPDDYESEDRFVLIII